MARFLTVCGLASFLLAGCASHADRGAGIGGLAGAGAGALIGEGSGHGVEGALLGGALGMLAGSEIGNAADRRDAAQQAQIARANSGAVTATDVVAMVQNGVSEEVIATHIRTNGVQQRVQPGDLITLRNQGVSDYLINAMQTAHVGGAAVAQQPVYGGPYYPAQGVIVQEVPGPVFYTHRRHWHPHYCAPPPRVGWSVGFSSRH
jgi:hypothetical protein